MAATVGNSTLPANTRVTAQLTGSFQTITNNADTFREKWLLALMAQPVTVEALNLQSQGWLERVFDLAIVSEPYAATVTVRTLAPDTIGNLKARIVDAAMAAGSYQPTISVASQGEAAQQALPPMPSGVIGDLLGGVGGAVRGIGDTVQAVPRTATLIIVGIVGIVALLAFSPNLKVGITR